MRHNLQGQFSPYQFLISFLNRQRVSEFRMVGGNVCHSYGPLNRTLFVPLLQTLQKLQNRAARIVTKSNFDAPSIGLIQSLNWPTVSDIIRGETATTVYKSLNGLVSEYLSSLFEKRSTRNFRELRNTETDLSIPLRETNNGQRAISFRGPKLWNSLELDVKQHHLLPPLREESNRKLVAFVPRPPEKQFSWTDGATVPK